MKAHRQPSKLSFISRPSFHRLCNTVYTLINDHITNIFTSIVADQPADERPQFCALLWGDEPPSRRETHHHVSPRLCA